jgi:hypothetical protein
LAVVALQHAVYLLSKGISFLAACRGVHRRLSKEMTMDMKQVKSVAPKPFAATLLRQAHHAVRGENFCKAVTIAVSKCLENALAEEPRIDSLPSFDSTDPAHIRTLLKASLIAFKRASSVLEDAARQIEKLAKDPTKLVGIDPKREEMLATLRELTSEMPANLETLSDRELQHLVAELCIDQMIATGALKETPDGFVSWAGTN